MAKNIWEESIGEEVVKQNDKKFYINTNIHYPLKIEYLRNYINSHNISDINVDTLCQYFGDNAYLENNGLFITHLLCVVPSIPFIKKCKTLDAAMKIIDPNVGSIDNKYNYNYMQYYLLMHRRKIMNIYNDFNNILKMYKIGLENGLDAGYTDSYGYTIADYIFSICSEEDILSSIDEIISEQNFNGHDMLDQRYYDDDGYIPELQSTNRLKEVKIYSQLVNIYGALEFLLIRPKSYEKIIEKIKTKTYAKK